MVDFREETKYVIGTLMCLNMYDGYVDVFKDMYDGSTARVRTLEVRLKHFLAPIMHRYNNTDMDTTRRHEANLRDYIGYMHPTQVSNMDTASRLKFLCFITYRRRSTSMIGIMSSFCIRYR